MTTIKLDSSEHVKQVAHRMSAFAGPTYQRVHINFGPRRVDHELRLYMYRRIRLDAIRGWVHLAQLIAEDFNLNLGCIQWETNRHGMCICFSCGSEPRADILEVVNLMRAWQSLKPIKV